MSSPNASGALFAQLEELAAECASKDMDIKRLTGKLTAATAAADVAVIKEGSLTAEQVEVMVSEAIKVMGMKEEHLHDELAELERKLTGVQRQVGTGHAATNSTTFPNARTSWRSSRSSGNQVTSSNGSCP